MRHIPEKGMHEVALLGFAEARTAPPDKPYDRERWLYVPPFYAEYRYVLGTKGQQPLICVGLNPSTAAPGALDRTLQSVERVARYNGFDSFLMMNLYAQRATLPGHMDRDVSLFLRAQNQEAFRFLLGQARTVWAAWGAVMETRGYLRDCVRDFAQTGQALGANWVTAGQRSKAGHPHHPLYLKTESPFEPFDLRAYLDRLGQGV